MNRVFRFLLPHVAWSDLPPILAVAALGGIIAGIYGIAHDQITFSISPEYFAKLKFQQFHYADFGWGDRAFAATIGFLASWWVGFIIAWFLARRLVPGQPRGRAYRQIAAAFGCVMVCGFTFAAASFALGLWRGPQADYSSWQWAIDRFGIDDTWSFVRVAYIHNGSYLGGFVGLIVALICIRPRRQAKPALPSSLE